MKKKNIHKGSSVILASHISPSVIRKHLLHVIITLLLVVMSSWSTVVYAQQAILPKVTVHASGKSLKTVLDQIGRQYGYAIYYDVAQLKNVTVTVNVDKADLRQVLTTLLQGTGLRFRIVDKNVVVTAVDHNKKRGSLSGRITDMQGSPLPGVVLSSPDLSQRVITDADGRYTFPEPVPYGSLVQLSYIGMKPQTVLYAGGGQLNISMEEEKNELETVIVTGFQTISRERSTGAANIIDKKELERVQAANLGTKLEGLAPGVNSYRGGMLIRGISSFSVGSTPLLVVDGQPVNGMGLNDLNSSDVESVTVLKDAAATSLYGVRASNGVIVVTTKKGTTKKPDIKVSANFYINPLPSLDYQHYASTSDIIDYEQEYLLNDPSYKQDPLGYFTNRVSLDAPQYMSQVSRLYYQMALGNINERQLTESLNELRTHDYRKEYRDALEQASIKQDYNMSVTQATDASNLYFSARFENDGSHYKYGSDNRYTFTLNNEFKITKWFKFNVGNTLIVNDVKSYGAPFQSGTAAMPYDSIYNPDGSLAYIYPFNYYVSEQLGATDGLQPMGYNVIEEARNNRRNNKNLYWKFFTRANVDLALGLSWSVQVQYENRWANSEVYDEVNSYFMRRRVNEYATTNPNGGFNYNIPLGGHMSETNSHGSNLNIRTQLDYRTTFADKHDIAVLLGGEIREDKFHSTQNERYGYDDQKLTYQNVDWATLNKTGVIGQLSSARKTLGELLALGDTRHRYVSGYFNAGYTFNSIYAFNASVRIDQADLFGTDPKYRYRPLWSVGGSWNISNEKFLKDVKWINMLKFRVTYGITGNVDQSSSPYLLGAYITSPYSGANLTSILTPPNPTLRWEKTSTLNMGVDFMLIQRLRGAIDYYRRSSSDLLANKSLDPSIGFESARINNGSLLNTGVEMSLSYDWLRRGDWLLNTHLTVSYNHNKITNVGYRPTDALNMITNPRNNYLEGDALNTLYAYRYAGLTEDGNPSVYDADGNIVANQPVRDIDALVKVGKLDPTWNGAFDLTLSWKSLTLYTKLVYYAGHSLRTDVTPLYAGITSPNGAIHRDIVNRWRPDNRDTDIPSMDVYGLQDERNYQWKYADGHVASASFIKVRNITLSYALPQTWMKAIGFKDVQLHAQVNNPFYWAANGQGIDPEAYSANGGYRTSEQTASYILGLHVNF